jgi:serine/threonine-protein kinase
MRIASGIISEFRPREEFVLMVWSAHWLLFTLLKASPMASSTMNLRSPPETDDAETSPASDPAESGTRGIQSFASVDDQAALASFEGGDRYDETKVLGRGGMGEVRLCLDRRLRRHVAMKTIRYEAPATRVNDRARFVREALSQAQLEHPSIVPVYDVGQNEAGSLYFTMRRVQGSTLEHVLTRLRLGDDGYEVEYTRHRLLSAFSSVCLAVDYAHTRNVFHCDIKPANIMLGAFGEVYVLDWGIAATSEGESQPLQTSGTPGYMAPEQIKTLPVDARTDVYALGCTLFELLTLLPMHDGNAIQALNGTLAGHVERPSSRAPTADIAPELDAICMKATSPDPKDRYASARDLHDDLARYMAGDRDLALRREMSQQHLEAAENAAKAARAAGDGPEGLAQRSDALRAVGRALAFDPQNEEALRTLVELMTTPPKEMPKEAEHEMFAGERAFQRTRARAGSIAFIAWVLILPAFYLSGAATLATLLANAVVWSFLCLTLLYVQSRPRPDGRSRAYVPIVGGVAMAMTSLVTGPLLLTATFATTFSMGFTLAMRPRHRYVPMISGCLSVFVPWLLQRLDLLHASLPGLQPTEHASLLVLMTQLVCIVVAAMFSMRLREKLDQVQRTNHLNAWQLRQLLPKDAVTQSKD